MKLVDQESQRHFALLPRGLLTPPSSSENLFRHFWADSLDRKHENCPWDDYPSTIATGPSTPPSSKQSPPQHPCWDRPEPLRAPSRLKAQDSAFPKVSADSGPRLSWFDPSTDATSREAHRRSWYRLDNEQVSSSLYEISAAPRVVFLGADVRPRIRIRLSKPARRPSSKETLSENVDPHDFWHRKRLYDGGEEGHRMWVNTVQGADATEKQQQLEYEKQLFKEMALRLAIRPEWVRAKEFRPREKPAFYPLFSDQIWQVKSSVLQES